jgi:hypothetical protein
LAKSHAQRLLFVGACIALLTMIAALVTLGSIENAALFEAPLVPDSFHTHALAVKGRAHYVTDAEYELHSIAMPVMMASFFAVAGLGVWLNKVKRRDEKLEVEETLRRFGTWRHGD